MPRKKNYPATLAAAVEYCLKTLPVGTLEALLLPPHDELAGDHHFGLGMWVRNNLGLWRGNEALMEAIGAWHPDSASGPILDALAAYLRKHKDWKLRRRLLRAPKPRPPGG
ncbi:hypothetical protein EBR16_02405 [bacterium]|nr:hypothetical protein [bacterium]